MPSASFAGHDVTPRGKHAHSLPAAAGNGSEGMPPWLWQPGPPEEGEMHGTFSSQRRIKNRRKSRFS
jgi:hypothetical protein